MIIPRIRARVGQAEDTPENGDARGKWYFEIFVSELGKSSGNDEDERVATLGPWDTEAIAHKEMRRAVQICAEEWEKKVTGDDKPCGYYIDMKTNLKRRWDRSDEQ